MMTFCETKTIQQKLKRAFRRSYFKEVLRIVYFDAKINKEYFCSDPDIHV